MNIKSSQQLVEDANKTIETLSPEEVKHLMEKNEITLIDVRDIRELWRDGTIENSSFILIHYEFGCTGTNYNFERPNFLFYINLTQWNSY